MRYFIRAQSLTSSEGPLESEETTWISTPAYDDIGLRITEKNGLIDSIEPFDPLTGVAVAKSKIKTTTIYPAKHYLADPEVIKSVEKQIRADLMIEYEEMKQKENC